MTTKAVATSYTTGQTLYWYPLSRSLSDWTTYRTQAIEDSSPNLGRYQATLDTVDCDTDVDPYCQFYLFVGSSQPSSFDTHIQVVSLIAATAVISVNAPVGVTGSIKRIYRGVSYKSDNNRAFEWTFGDPGNIATPGSNVCTFAGVKRDDPTQTWSVEGDLSDAGGGDLTATFEFENTTVSALDLGEYEWKVTCVDDSSNIILIASTDRSRLTRLIDQ